MTSSGQLHTAFKVYFDDMDNCRKAGAWWCLLHVVLCLPDICAALESADGETKGKRYKAWCDKYVNEPWLTGNELYQIRCRVLHQGRAKADRMGRYDRFAFGHPSSHFTDHFRLEAGCLHVDVECLMNDVLAAVDRWIADIEASPSSASARHVAAHLPALVRVTEVRVPFVVGHGVAGQPLVRVVNKTN
ncbi:MAG: hypothetical protein ACKVXR_03845 [Planctomycetota bacterium]